MSRRRCSRITLLAVSWMLIAASCSSGSDEAEADNAARSGDDNYVTFEDSTPAEGGDPPPVDDVDTGRDQGSGQAVPAEVTPDVVAAAERFVASRNAVLVGEESESVLRETVSPELLVAIEAERDLSVAAIEAYDRDAMVSYQSTTHVLSSEETLRGLVVEICNERLGERIVSGFEIEFVHELLTFDVAVEPWMLTAVETVHDGKWETGGVTCIPPVMADRAVDVAATALSAIDAMLADPDLVASTELEDYLGGIALNSFEVGLAAPPFSDRRRVTPVEYRYEVLGIDPANAPYVAVVEVCRWFPDGAYDEVIATGERVLADPLWVEGSSSLDRVRVNLGPKYDYDTSPTDVLWDFDFAVEISCWP